MQSLLHVHLQQQGFLQIPLPLDVSLAWHGNAGRQGPPAATARAIVAIPFHRLVLLVIAQPIFIVSADIRLCQLSVPDSAGSSELLPQQIGRGMYLEREDLTNSTCQ